ncbi:hypothetical protein SAMN06296273_2212 [Nitrosomonas ureae]|jgi:hypothetical protein|uniref:Uncharacterized protein n=1 Tax=Nitrosomonas ureae TaxID=44577 RepID=A0A285BZK8_9PROT|nr:hypothetical protein SAMN06296273_2212 [Nitrosomonas ureae]
MFMIMKYESDYWMSALTAFMQAVNRYEKKGRDFVLMTIMRVTDNQQFFQYGIVSKLILDP